MTGNAESVAPHDVIVAVGPKGKEETGKVWWREYLEADGHEDCCHHTRFVTRPYKGEHSDGSASDA